MEFPKGANMKAPGDLNPFGAFLSHIRKTIIFSLVKNPNEGTEDVYGS